MFSGKTETGRLIAEASGMAFYDGDELIEAETGLKVFEIFDKFGEKGFREAEARVMAEFLGKAENAVLALGGGYAADLCNLGLLLRETRLVYLKASFGEIKKRIANASETALSSRPLAARKDLEAIKRLYDARLKYYERAGVTVECDGLTTAEAAEKVVEALGLRKAG